MGAIKWVRASKREPQMIPGTNSSRVLLIAKRMKSNPEKLTVGMGYLQRTSNNSYVWQDIVSRTPGIPRVVWWAELPNPPEIDSVVGG